MVCFFILWFDYVLVAMAFWLYVYRFLLFLSLCFARLSLMFSWLCLFAIVFWLVLLYVWLCIVWFCHFTIMSGFVWPDFALCSALYSLILPFYNYAWLCVVWFCRFNLVWSGIAALTLHVLVCLIVWYGLNLPVALSCFVNVWSWLWRKSSVSLFIPFTTF